MGERRRIHRLIEKAGRKIEAKAEVEYNAAVVEERAARGLAPGYLVCTTCDAVAYPAEDAPHDLAWIPALMATGEAGPVCADDAHTPALVPY